METKHQCHKLIGRNSKMKQFEIFFIVGILLILALPTVSAFEFDNSQNIKDKIGKAGYNDIEIKNSFGFGKTLWSGTLETNTDYCTTGCSATQTITLYEKGSLVNDIRFMIQQDDDWEEGEIKDYQIYYKKNKKWTEYIFGEELPAGTYEVLLEGSINNGQTVDWVYYSQGEWLEEWALWVGESYQEFANETAFEQGGDGWSTTQGSVYANDGSWATYAGCRSSGQCSFYENYTVPTWMHVNISETVWKIKDTSSDYNVTLNQSCINNITDTVIFRIYILGAGVGNSMSYYCNDGTGWVDMFTIGARTSLYETGIYWYGNEIILNSPEDDYISSMNEIEFNASVITTETITNMSLWHNGTGVWHRNQTEDLTGTTNESILNSTFPDGNYLWTFSACDSDGDCGFAEENRTFTVDTITPEINITYPYGYIDYMVEGTNLTVNWTWSDIHIDSCWIEYPDGTNTTIDCESNSTGINITSSSDTNVTIWINDTAGNEGSSTITWAYRAFYNNATWNETSYYTKTEGYILNISSDGNSTVSAILYYNNSAVTATKTGDNSEMIFTSEIGAIEDIGNQSFYWEITQGATLFNTTQTYYQDVDSLTFGLCNATNGATFINFTFQDEDSFTTMNATFQTSNWNYYIGDGSVTNTLSYTNTNIYNQSYAFCSNVNETLHNSATIRYAQTNYPQRIFEQSADLTNVVRNQLLYLLATADGQYVSFVTQDIIGNPISNVSVNVERQFNETWYTIGLDSSDDTGGTTFFLNYDYDHRITFTHDDYVNLVLIIRPTQTIYTVQMSSITTTAANYNSTLAGITYWKSPASGTFLTPGNVYNFTYDIIANLTNLLNYTFRLVDLENNILNQTSGSNAAGGNLSFTFNVTSNYTYLYTKYYINIGDGGGLYQIDPSIFPVEEVYIGDASIIKWFQDFSLTEPSPAERFDQLFWFFFILFIGMAAFTKFTGAELSSPGVCIPIVVAITWIASFGGYLTVNIDTTGPFINQFGVALMMTLLSGGYTLGIVNKT